MSEETWDRVLGDIFAALDRDAAAEGQLIALAPLLSDEQILRAWAYLAHDEARRWRARGALAHEALRRVVGRAERDGRGTAKVRIGTRCLSSVPTLVVPMPWGRSAARTRRRMRSAVAGLSARSCARTAGGSARCPWRSKETTNSGRKGTRRLAQTTLAAAQATSRAATTAGP